MIKKTPYFLHCLRCERSFYSHSEEPTSCGKCKSKYWNVPKKINIQINQCVKCKRRWEQRSDKKPKQCPYCHNPNWDKISSKDLISFIVGK